MKLILTVLLASGLTVAAAPMIETVAGTGEAKVGLFKGAAAEVNIGHPGGVEIGPDGHLYIGETGNGRIFRMNEKTGKVQCIAGTGEKGFSGNGGPAIKAAIQSPYEVRVDSKGNIYIAERLNHVIRRIDKNGIIHPFIGNGTDKFSGDGGPADKAGISQPHSFVIDETRGVLYMADIGNQRIRRVNMKSGIIDTMIGDGQKKALPVSGKPIKGQTIKGPRALALDGDTLWVALREGNSVWKIDLKTERIYHVACTGQKGFSGDGGNAKLATCKGPKGIAVDAAGNVYLEDTENQAIRKIDAKTNIITTIAGYGPEGKGYNGDGMDARKAKLNRPHGICVDKKDNVYIADTGNNRIRRISQD